MVDKTFQAISTKEAEIQKINPNGKNSLSIIIGTSNYFSIERGEYSQYIRFTSSTGANSITATNKRLDIVADKGLVLPKLTTTERDAVIGTSGMIIFNTTINKLQIYTASGWETITSS